MTPAPPHPVLTKDMQDILDFLILPSEFEICQTIAQEALDRMCAPHTTTPSERDKVLNELVKMVSKRCGCNQDIEHADIPIIHVDELAEIIAELRTQTTEAPR